MKIVCANCGKAESDDIKLKTCAACKGTEYCSRECQAAHWPNHKAVCKNRAAEILDEKLFKDPPARPECPICMLPLPFDAKHHFFKSCCGQTICMGCVHSQNIEDYRNAGEYVGTCVFCSAPGRTSEKQVRDDLKRGVARNDASSFHNLGTYYMHGRYGLPKKMTKAIELLLKAGELGYAEAYTCLGCIYKDGDGVKRNMKRAVYYWGLGAIGGSITSRHNLGTFESHSDNVERALKHYMISAKAGYHFSFDSVKKYFDDGKVTKDEYVDVMRLYQKNHKEASSDMRDEAVIYAANPSLYVENYCSHDSI